VTLPLFVFVDWPQSEGEKALSPPSVMEAFACGAEISSPCAAPPKPAEETAPVSYRFVTVKDEAEAKERQSQEPSCGAEILPPAPIRTPLRELSAPLREFTRGSE
jgi:hypothetical protein